jgi:hypothetical protein
MEKTGKVRGRDFHKDTSNRPETLRKIKKTVIIVYFHADVQTGLNTSASTVTGYGLDDQGLIAGRVQGFYFLPPRPDQP